MIYEFVVEIPDEDMPNLVNLFGEDEDLQKKVVEHLYSGDYFEYNGVRIKLKCR